MKKLTITIALLLVVAFAMPVFGASFSDVPSDHWAYSAINKLVAAGIVEGYPDGEFKGQQSMTRYEMAVMVSRALDNIADEQKEMAAGLTTGQAEDVTAIVKALMEKNTSEEFTDAQAKKVADIVDALTFELKAELKVLGAKVDTLGKDVDEIKATIAALDVPEDNIEFSGVVTTYAQVGSYGDDDEQAATAEALADGDVLDADLSNNGGGDYDDFPAEQAFYQEIDLLLNGSLKGINFDLAVDTITNGFTDYEGYNYDDYTKVLGEQGDENGIDMDTALLTITQDNWTVKIGDMGDYDVDDSAYFYDVEDAEGIEFTGPVYGFGVKAFAVGYDDGNLDEFATSDDLYYGVAVSKEFMNNTVVTGKVYQADLDSADEKVTDIAVAVSTDLTDSLTLSGEAVYNELDEADTDDSMFKIAANYIYTDTLSFRGSFQTVGDEFNGGVDHFADVQADMEEDYDFDKYTLGTTYVVNTNNSLDFDVAMVSYDADTAFSQDFVDDLGYSSDTDEDKYIYSIGWNNTYGKFTNHVGLEYVENDYYTDETDDNTTVIELGTVYDWTAKTDLRAKIVNKNADLYDNSDVWDKDMNFTYLQAGIDHQLADNISWITDVQYITGDVDQLTNHSADDSVDSYVANGDNADINGNFITTQLSVSF
ncbi:S-layer homology domain-containing protein [Halanaerobium salsuginis]|uniref:S-layer homology domain-containing protein n=1 Tax=Halanaerobium salsuginis TaxID=29563 RepID=A0A1I4FNY8_9FIRM|nr:S-layer homology domain-containing protein [Halanaerobium salsuginis]SFL18667.1 S-layer homology domain-containing protein [Halanaerobium salsuginis]